MESNKKKSIFNKLKSIKNAFQSDDPNFIRQILNEHPKLINFCNDAGQTPLNEASYRGYLTFVKVILQNENVKVNLQDDDGWTPLYSATVSKNITIVKLLLRHKDIDIKLKSRHSKTSTMLAAQLCFNKILKMLIQHGANCNGLLKWVFREWCLKDTKKKTIEILTNWKSYLPEWCIKTHKYYPKEFETLVVCCCCVFNRLNKTINACISKDIRLLLIEYVAEDWKKN